MGDFVKALPAVLMMILGVISLGFGVAWMMSGNEAQGPAATLGALAGYVISVLFVLRLLYR